MISTWVRVRSSYRLASVLFFLLAGCVVALAAVDRASISARVVADGRFDHAFFQGFNPRSERWESRVGYRHSVLSLQHLGARARARVVLRVRARRGVLPLRVFANGAQVHKGSLGQSWKDVPAEVVADDRGRVDLRFRGGGVRVAAVEVLVVGPGRVPARRLGAYVVLASLLGVVGFWVGAGFGEAALAALSGSLVFCAGLLVARFHILATLPLVLVALAALPVIGWLFSRCGLPRGASRWAAAAFVLKVALVSQPAFPSIDGAFHAHNLERWRSGGQITSRAPGVEQNQKVGVPYPPALYAMLTPLVAIGAAPPSPWVDDRPGTELLVRVAQAVLEGLSPILVFFIASALGASSRAAGQAAVAAALMPESLLVLGKGIAANTLGMFATLLVVLASARRAHPVAFGLLAVFAFTSHFGAAMLLVTLLGAHALYAVAARGRTAAMVAPQLGVAAIALGVAWLAYYHDAFRVTGSDLGAFGGSAIEHPGSFFGVRGYRIGKTLQDLVLKFGGLPLVLAGLAISRTLTSRVRDWWVPWAATGVAAGLGAILTPVPLRFEYFLVPIVAIAAGFGAERLLDIRRSRLINGTWALLLIAQIALGVAMLCGRVRLISVTMESPRWPFPFG